MGRRKASPFEGVQTAEQLADALQKHAGTLTIAQLKSAQLIAKMRGWNTEPLPKSSDVEIADPKPVQDVIVFNEMDFFRADAVSFVHSVESQLRRRVSLAELLQANAGKLEGVIGNEYSAKPWTTEPKRLEALKTVLRWIEEDGSRSRYPVTAKPEDIASVKA